MKPLGIEGFATTGGLKLLTRNLLPWLDLWFGEPGSTGRYVKETHSGEYTIIELETN